MSSDCYCRVVQGLPQDGDSLDLIPGGKPTRTIFPASRLFLAQNPSPLIDEFQVLTNGKMQSDRNKTQNFS